MNFVEGLRRVGLVLGVCGGLLGATFGYVSAEKTWKQVAAAKKFESLIASPMMQQITKAAKESKANRDPNFIPDVFGVEDEAIIVDHNGVKQVTVDSSGAITSIELSAGEVLKGGAPPPDRTDYLIPLLAPIAGFLVPWVTVRVLGWVLQGFFLESPR